VAGFVLLVAIAGTLGKIQSDARAVNRLDPVSHTVQTICRPVSNLAAGVVNGLGNFRSGFADVRNMEAENRALRAEVAAIGMYTEQVTRLNREVDTLRQFQNLPPIPGKSNLVTEVSGYFPDVNRISIPVGQAEGVRPGMPVTTPAGLFAIVQTVDKHSSQALLLTSPSVKVGAMDISRNPPSTGFLKGQDSQALSFTLFEPKAQISVGDLIVTSGYGEHIPRGIVIGRVVAVEDSPELGLKRAQVDPAVEIGEVREVSVVR
jgi:rod shape-determining protein MreC